jgi:hypothetical protein
VLYWTLSIFDQLWAEEQTMTKKAETKNLVEVKTALADKYDRLARVRSSKPAKRTLQRHAERFRSQAENIAKSRS